MGKDSNLHIAELSEPAGKMALKYVDSEVPQNCNTQEVREIFPTCTDYPPFIFTGSGKSEEDIRKPALAEEFKERPEGKRCRIDACPPVGSSGAKLHKVALPLKSNLFSLFRRQTGSSHSFSIKNSGGIQIQKRKRKKLFIH